MALCEDFKSAGDDPASDEELRVLRSRLIEVNKKISDEIYASNRAGIRPEGRTNWYCRFVLFFQVMNYLTLHCREGENLIDAGVLYRDFLYQFEHVTPDSDYHRLSFRLHGPDIRSFRLRFALRQIITVTPCIIFVRASNLPNVVWLVISVFFMMIPFTDHTMKRVRQRVYGTTGGVIISLLLYTVFTGFPARVIIMTIANFMIYGSGGYGFTTAYITCSALALQAIDGAVGTVLLQRLGYTLIGAVIAMAANRFIFPIRSRRQIDYLADRLGVLREKMRSDTPQDESDEGHRESRVDQMIIQSYLLTKGIEGMYRTLPENERDFDYGEFEREQMHFMEEYLSVHFLKRYNK